MIFRFSHFFFPLFVSFAFAVPHAAHAEVPSVVLNELMWMGSPASAQDEWIELRNTTEADIDLSGFRLTKLSGGVETDMLTIPQGTIPAQGFFVIANYATTHGKSALDTEPDYVDTAVSLANTKLRIRLYDAGGILLDTADDGIGVPLSGAYTSGEYWASMERHRADLPGDRAEAWHASTSPLSSKGFFATPGAENSNQPPTILCNGPEELLVGAEGQFLASAADADSDTLEVVWEFPDGGEQGESVTRTFSEEGEFTVTCTADDGRAISSGTLALFVSTSTAVPRPDGETLRPLPETAGSGQEGSRGPEAGKVPCSEPAIRALAEEEEVAGGAAQEDFSDRVLLTGLLPNPVGSDRDGESIEITNFDDREVDLKGWSVTDGTRTYTFSHETPIAAGAGFTLPRAVSHIALNNSGDTVRLLNPSGTTVNGVEYRESREGEMFIREGESVHWFWTGEDDEESAAGRDAEVQDEPAYQAATIRNLNFLNENAKVRFSGAVIALPGQLFAHTLFVADGDELIRVYSGTDRFPELALGETVTVSGVLAQDRSGPKVNLQRNGAVAATGGEASETVVQTFTGEVLEKSRSTFVLETGAERIVVRVKRGTGIALSGITPGISVMVSGFFFGGEFLPRTADDVARISGAVRAAATDESVEVLESPQSESLKEQLPRKPAAILAFILSFLMVAGSAVLFVIQRRGSRRFV